MQAVIKQGFTEVRITKLNRVSELSAMTEWCWQNVGYGVPNLNKDIDESLFNRRDHAWYSQVWFGYYAFWFKDPVMATFFKLKWS